MKRLCGRGRFHACARAILSAIWTLEDGGAILDDDSRLALAVAIRPLLG